LRRQDSPKLVESVLSLESPNLLRMPYAHFVISALYLVPNPQKILVIGLGGGNLSKTFANLFPEAKIDTVDIEKEIADIAQNFFFFKVSSKLKIHVKDGYSFVMNLPEINTYDLIVMDAMERGCSPESFRTEPFVRKLKAHLNPGGVIAVNTLTQCSFRSVEQGLYEKVFGDLYIVQEPESGNPNISNIILLGMKGAFPSWASIQDRAEAYLADFQKRGIETDALLSKMSLKINKTRRTEG
jgi:spermidine synthase